MIMGVVGRVFSPCYNIPQVISVQYRHRTTQSEALITELDSSNNINGIKCSVDILHGSNSSKSPFDHISINTCMKRQQELNIPSPRKLPIVGNIIEFLGSFGSSAHTFLQKRMRQFGPIYEFSSFGEKMVFLFDYSDISRLRAAEGEFPKHIDFKHLRRYRTENHLPMGVLVSNGEEWIRQRRMLAGHMLKPETVAKYFDGLQSVAEDAVTYQYQTAHGAQRVNVEQLAGKYALEGIGQAVMGTRLGCFEEVSPPYLDRFLFYVKRNFQDAKQLLICPESIWKFLPAWYRHNEGWNYILDTARYHVDNQLSDWNSKGKASDDSVLGLLHRDGSMSRNELHVNMADIMLAAIDTTANAILWVISEISRHEHVQREILKEWNSIQGRQPLTYKQLHAMRYLRAVLKETLRLHPVAFFTSRITRHPVLIKGHEIPANTHVACSMYVMGRDKALFPDPNSFLPERWLDGDNKNGAFYARVPFGSGVRMCLGRRIAETEILLFILEICKAFILEPESSADIEPTFRIFMVPKEPLHIKFIPRANTTQSTS